MARKHRGRRDDVDVRFARLAKALSSPRRLELLDALVRCPCTVENLANHTGMTMANASQHLQVLRGAGLVDSEKDGLFVCYRVASVEVPAFLLALRRLAASMLGDVEGILPHSVTAGRRLDPGEPLTNESGDENGEVNIQPREEGGDVHVHDRRSRVPKLRTMPMAELEEQDGSSRAQIGACCRGPYCLLAPVAESILRGYTRDVVRPGCRDSAMSLDS
jgi:DNA-binding transcriptional ArsR family regulator